MSETFGSSLLGMLREKANAQRALDAASRRPAEKAAEEINRRLWFAFRWLDEAVGHLNVLRPAVSREFRLPGILAMDRPRYERGRVVYRRRSLQEAQVIERLEFFWRLRHPAPIVVRVKPGAVHDVEKRLRSSAMRFEYDAEHDDEGVLRFGRFDVQPSISAFAGFRGDYARGLVHVALHNVDRLEPVMFEFQPDRLDEPALEDLIRLLLGASDRFLYRAPVALGRHPGWWTSRETATEASPIEEQSRVPSIDQVGTVR